LSIDSAKFHRDKFEHHAASSIATCYRRSSRYDRHRKQMRRKFPSKHRLRRDRPSCSGLRLRTVTGT